MKNRVRVASSMWWVLEERLERRLKRARLSRIEEFCASIRCVSALVWACAMVTWWRSKASL